MILNDKPMEPSLKYEKWLNNIIFVNWNKSKKWIDDKIAEERAIMVI